MTREVSVLRKVCYGFHLVDDQGQVKARFLSLKEFIKVLK